jgi:DNA modification methylase
VAGDGWDADRMTAPDEALFGVDLFGDPIRQTSLKGPLAERFTFAPFSVFDARSGPWQERKDAWISLGLKSEIGRGDDLIPGWKQLTENFRGKGSLGGVSIFDPVLCESLIRWFSAVGDEVLDPFAGGSVRGIVSNILGRHYTGIDIRAEQCAENERQAGRICTNAARFPRYITGDAMAVLPALEEERRFDFAIACPPYGNLERYSDDPRDLSTMDYALFLQEYSRIILRMTRCLRPQAYVAWVVADFRDRRTGNYYGFVADTILAFRTCGLELYNDGILVTMLGTMPVRVASQFEKTRKLGKTHQNVLIFRKP